LVGDYGSALAAAAYRGKKGVIELLLESGADVNALLQVGDYGSALAAAAYRGKNRVIELLLESGADVNALLQAGDYGSALGAAMAGDTDNEEVVQFLIKSGARHSGELVSIESLTASS
jgi:ankyrin repeat protein